jgi:hypothetical protein
MVALMAGGGVEYQAFSFSSVEDETGRKWGDEDGAPFQKRRWQGGAAGGRRMWLRLGWPRPHGTNGCWACRSYRAGVECGLIGPAKRGRRPSGGREDRPT